MGAKPDLRVLEAQPRFNGRDVRTRRREVGGPTPVSHQRLLGRTGSLRAILLELGRSSDLEAGRVFVNGKRVTAEMRLVGTEQLEVFSARQGDDAEIRILQRWGDLIAVEKPHHLASIPDHLGYDSLVERVRKLETERQKLPIAVVHPASRLDVGVSGVVLLGLSRQAAAQLEAAKRARRIERTYLALAQGTLAEPGIWDLEIGQARGLLRTKPRAHAGAKRAVTQFVPLAQTPAPATALLLRPITGRTHQLRIHAASAGAPLFGDKIHGGPTLVRQPNGGVIALERIYLHALAVRVLPERAHEPTLDAICPVPTSFAALWNDLGGDADVWDSVIAQATQQIFVDRSGGA